MVKFTMVWLQLILLTAWIWPQAAWCGQNPPMEEILQGVDEEANSNGDDMDRVLEGFDSPDDAEPQKNDAEEEAILEGFEEDHLPASKEDQAASGPRALPISIDGFLKLAGSYNFQHNAPKAGETDWRGLSKLRPEILLQAEWKPVSNWKLFVSGKGHYDLAYAINGQENYSRRILDHYEREIEWRDTYLSGSPIPELDLKLGRQIVVWGKSDNLRITDVLNPVDFREPGLTDIEDLRLPVCMSRADYYFGAVSFSGLAIHEIRFNKIPQPGSDFYPSPISPPQEEIPASTWRHTQFALALNGIFSGWDLSLYWADKYQERTHFEGETLLQWPALRLVHDRVRMLGAAANIAFGNLLLTSEAAHFSGLRFFNAHGKFNRLDALIGCEYTGISKTTISLELADRHLFNFDSALEELPDQAKQDLYQSVARLTREFKNDTLALTLVLNFFGLTGEDGRFQRLTLDYDITDAVNILVGIILYQSGDVLGEVEDNDRLIFEAKYSF